MIARNLTESLISRGLSTADTVDRVFDIGPSFGGPMRRDRLWFFVTARDRQGSPAGE